MDSKEIFESLEFISEDPSKNNKIAYLKELLQDNDFRRVVEYAYNPYITFGILEFEDFSRTFEPKTWHEGVWTLLDNLKERYLTGHNAREAIWENLNNCDSGSIELFRRILNKDLRAGFDVKSINKAMPNLIPSFGYMRCSLPKDVKLENWDWEAGVISQEKMDGLFVNVTIGSDGLSMHTRKGQPFPLNKFQHIVNSFHHLMIHRKQYHGEIVVQRGDVLLERKVSNGIINSVMKGGDWGDDERPILFLWDCIDALALKTGMDPMPYGVRNHSNNYPNTYTVRQLKSIFVYSLEAALLHFKNLRSIGKEGTVIKEKDGVWKNGTSKSQVKLKDVKIADLRFKGLLPGTGKNVDTFGSMYCESEDGLLSVAVSGFTDEWRAFIFKNQEGWLDNIVSVVFNEVIQDKNGKYSLFLPRFDEFRYDKTEADTLERILSL